MPLNYISPAEAVKIFTAEAPVHLYGAYIAVPTAQAVIVTEGADVVRELIGLKELIDVPPASVTSEFVQLTHADAEKVADLLNKLLEPKKDVSQAADASIPAGVPADLGNNAPMSNERDLLSGPATIEADLLQHIFRARSIQSRARCQQGQAAQGFPRGPLARHRSLIYLETALTTDGLGSAPFLPGDQNLMLVVKVTVRPAPGTTWCAPTRSIYCLSQRLETLICRLTFLLTW
jgi:hypothetical protein